MSERHAEIDHRNGKLIVASYSRPSGWGWFMNGYFEVLDDDADEIAVGAATHRALERSEVDVPIPTREQSKAGFDRPILDALSLRSTSAYMKGARSVAVKQSGGPAGLELIPRENRGRDGFSEIQEAKEQVPPQAGAGELGAAARRALERATDRPR